MQKNCKFFLCVEVRILCKKVKYVWSSNFPEAITIKMQIGNDSFVFQYSDTHKQKISNFTLILLKLIYPLSIMCSPPNASIILHTRRHNCQLKVCYALGFYVSTDFHFSHFGSLKARFSHHSFRPRSYVLMGLSGWRSVIV